MSTFGILIGLSILVAGTIIGWLLSSFLGAASMRASKEQSKKIILDAKEEAENLKGVLKPYSIIIPGKLHFIEKEVLESFG